MATGKAEEHVKMEIIGEITNACMKLSVRRLDARLKKLEARAIEAGLDRRWFAAGKIAAWHKLAHSHISGRKFRRYLWKKRKLTYYNSAPVDPSVYDPRSESYDPNMAEARELWERLCGDMKPEN
ncbi:MAG: hypothetical protein FWD71_21310 [Oscillospiraceae bacterium]|nr:hypothetical protein [Oscillospiraceae bacterium]